jgi:hypothetical protein
MEGSGRRLARHGMGVVPGGSCELKASPKPQWRAGAYFLLLSPQDGTWG